MVVGISLFGWPFQISQIARECSHGEGHGDTRKGPRELILNGFFTGNPHVGRSGTEVQRGSSGADVV
jgi:hypothetical protein